MNLIVGRLDARLERAAAVAFQDRGITFPEHWRTCPKGMATFDIYNLATLNVFHEHIFLLDGLPNVGESIARTRFRHLPFHVFDVWLPADFQPTPDPEIRDGEWQVPLLSCQGLLRDLELIKHSSDVGLGSTPEGYDLMRESPREFYRSKISLKDKNTMIQWIWRGLYDAAQLAVDQSVPLLAAE